MQHWMRRLVVVSFWAVCLSSACSQNASSEQDEGDEGDEGGAGGQRSEGQSGSKGGSGGGRPGTGGGGAPGTGGGRGGNDANAGNGGNGGIGAGGNSSGAGGAQGGSNGADAGAEPQPSFCSAERDRCYKSVPGTAPVSRPMKANAPSFCTGARAFAKGGDLSGSGPVSDPTAAGAKDMPGKVVDPAVGEVTIFKKIYVPSGYDAAKGGTVGIGFVLGEGMRPARTYSGYTGNQFTIEGFTDALARKGEIPTLILVWPAQDGGSVECRDTRLALDQWRTSLLPFLKTKYSKISNNPDHRVVFGQSTAGAIAFDVAWMGTDIVTKVFSGSGSYVCFQRITESDNLGYGKLARSCPAKPIRVAMSVGKCDIMGTCEERLAAGCSGCTPGGQVDSSQCAATWSTSNADLAAALKEKGYPYQFVKTPGGHEPDSWLAYFGDRLRWLFSDITCFE